MKTQLRCIFLAALAFGWAASPAFAGDLKLTMQGGRVTIIAHDVPLRQILQEWARVGSTNIVNAEKVPGAPLTLELVDVPEQQALDTLLRSAAGYMAAPRPVGTVGASVYDRIMILPTSRPPAATAAAVAPQPFQQPRPQPMPVDDDDEEPVNMPMQNPPVVGAFPGPNSAQPPQPVTQQAPGQQPPGQQPPGQQQPGQQPPPVMTAPRPGALPAPTVPTGAPNPYQSVIRPGPGGPGGPEGGGPGGGPEGDSE
jgi:hypothetical protein